MFQNVEDLKNEIEVFRNNMNRSNGSIALVSEAIEKLNSNLYTLKQISEKLDLSKNELESKICALESNQKNIEAEMINKINGLNSEIKVSVDSLRQHMQSQLKTIKILGGIIIALLVLSVVLSFII